MERSTLRIIDANFNRAREAVRLMEEFCRFALNNISLSARTKQLRHRLSSAAGHFNMDMLAASRDSADDVGRAMQVADQLSRTDLKDCFTAAAKRLTEALRVLAETSQVIEPSVAPLFEQLRFDAYTLEKDVLLFSDPYEKFRDVGLYILVTVMPDDDKSKVVDLASACAAGGTDCIQLRAKGLADGDLVILAERFSQACRSSNVISIINDRADIASMADADGFHLGQNDLPITQARKMAAKPMIIGLSTHNSEQLKAAIDQNPIYIALGPAFATPTKPSCKPAGPDYIQSAVKLLDSTGIGGVAVGGITITNIDSVLQTGVRTIAVCSAVTKAAKPEEMCRMLKQRITAFA